MSLSALALRHVLFDLDGTLIDSSELHARAFQTVIDQNRPELGDRFRYDMERGKPTYAVFEGLGIEDPQEILSLTSQKQKLYREAIQNGELQAMEGALDLLGWLTDCGIGVHLVTGSSRKSVEGALRSAGLDRYLQTIITADDVDNGKPAPDAYANCVLAIGADANVCLAVEDAISGIQSAQGAGLRVAGVFDPTVQDIVDYWFPDLLSLRSGLGETVGAEL